MRKEQKVYLADFGNQRLTIVDETSRTFSSVFYIAFQSPLNHYQIEGLYDIIKYHAVAHLRIPRDEIHRSFVGTSITNQLIVIDLPMWSSNSKGLISKDRYGQFWLAVVQSIYKGISTSASHIDPIFPNSRNPGTVVNDLRKLTFEVDGHHYSVGELRERTDLHVNPEDIVDVYGYKILRDQALKHLQPVATHISLSGNYGRWLKDSRNGNEYKVGLSNGVVVLVEKNSYLVYTPTELGFEDVEQNWVYTEDHFAWVD